MLILVIPRSAAQPAAMAAGAVHTQVRLPETAAMVERVVQVEAVAAAAAFHVAMVATVATVVRVVQEETATHYQVEMGEMAVVADQVEPAALHLETAETAAPAAVPTALRAAREIEVR